MSNNPILIPLSTMQDFSLFYSIYTTKNNELREEFHNRKFRFNISLKQLLSQKESVESLLFELALISQHFKNKAQFQLLCTIPKKPNQQKNQGEYYRYKEIYNMTFKIFSYMSTVDELIDVMILDEEGNLIDTKADENVKRMLPIIEVNRELLDLLISPINSKIVERWLEGKLKLTYEDAENKQIRYLCNQCARLLYGDMDGGKVLSDLRKRAFSSKYFVGVMNNIPFISLLVFAMFDYAYREDAAEAFKNIIKKELGYKNVTLKEKDILEQLQYEQKYEWYQRHETLKRNGYDNKTVFEYMDLTADKVSEDDKLHPFIIKELYEAITISEGLHQLIENIVHHAGDQKDKGEGALSCYIRNLDKDWPVLENKYPTYFKSNEPHAKFMLEVNIADLSNTNIPTEFRKNNKQFRTEEHSKYPNEIGNPVDVFDNIRLEDFFKPDEKKIKWWRFFFSFPDRVINHYGLQIFNSIIEAKGGYFFVQSGDETYSSASDSEHTLIKDKGTIYTILLPLDGRAHFDNNIYDSMFNYSLNGYVGKHMKVLEPTDIPEKPSTLFEKVKYIEDILQKLPSEINENEILCFDLAKLGHVHLECLIKAVLKLIFSRKGSGPQNGQIKQQHKLYISFVNCQNYQLIDILRIIALYYDKQGINQNMNSVEIYVRGIVIGEEILIYGENLETVRNNISQSACMRGLSYEYIDTLDKILSDRGVR